MEMESNENENEDEDEGDVQNGSGERQLNWANVHRFFLEVINLNYSPTAKLSSCGEPILRYSYEKIRLASFCTTFEKKAFLFCACFCISSISSELDSTFGKRKIWGVACKEFLTILHPWTVSFSIRGKSSIVG